MRCLIALVAVLIWITAPSSASAATLNLRVADRFELDAPTVTTFPVGTSSVVAIIGYEGLPGGTELDVALVNAFDERITEYQEPIRVGGSGTAVVRLFASEPLAPGLYRIVVQVDGIGPIEAPLTIGPGAAAPTAIVTAPATPPVVGPPAASATPPVQLAAPTPDPILANMYVARPRSVVAGRDVRFGLANVLPDGAVVPGVPESAGVAWMTRALDAGAGGNRWEFRWDRIESAPGVFDWSETDRIVAANQRAGLPLLAILIGTPSWAGATAASPPTGLHLPPILPDGSIPNDNAWARFVHHFAERYCGQIDAYEIWNEPNRPDFWSGTADDYYRLLSSAMATIRHADPAARVVFGGLDGFRDTRFLERVLAVAVADPAPPGRRGAFDVFAWHAYHRPVDVYAGTQVMRALLARHGLNQPIWITETNVAAWDDRRVRGEDAQPYPWSATADEQATFLLETFAYAVAADVERIFLYRASDIGEGEAWGLLQSNGTPRLAERAFRFATATFAGAHSARCEGNERVERIVIQRPGQRVTVVWSLGPEDAGVVLDAPSGAVAELRDKIGGVGQIESTDGRYVLSLPGASASNGTHVGDWIIGGDPYVVIEALAP